MLEHFNSQRKNKSIMERKFTEQEQTRRNKIDELKKSNILAFNGTVKPTISCIEIFNKFNDKTREEIYC